MGLFTDKEKMFIPLSVDNVDTNRTSYFFSNKKMIGVFLAILPYVLIFTLLLKVGAGLIPIAVVTLVYLIIFSYFLRFWVFEEVRLKNMLKEKDENVISGASHFWLIDKVGSSDRDDGLIYYQRDGRAIKRGLVVYFDRGSNVGVPEGHYEQFRQTKMEFLRELYARGMDFQWYEVQKKAEMPPTLVNYANLLDKEQNPALRMLLKLQLNINSLYTMEAEQRYVDYIVVTNKRFSNMKRFRNLLEDIVRMTLKSNGYLKDVHILGKEEVDKFFQIVLMTDTFNSNYVRKSVDMKPFNHFAKLKRVIGEDGRAVPLELLDELKIDGNGKTFEDMLVEDKKKEEKVEQLRKQRYNAELAIVRKSRMKDEITHEEYQKVIKELNKKYDPETYDPEFDRKQRELKRKKELEQKEAERLEKRGKKKEEPNKDWYKDGVEPVKKIIQDTKEVEDIFSSYTDSDEFK